MDGPARRAPGAACAPSTRNAPPSGNAPDRTLGPGRSASTATGRPAAADRDRTTASRLEVFGQLAVAQVEAEHVDPRRRAARRSGRASSDAGPERGHDLRTPAHACCLARERLDGAAAHGRRPLAPASSARSSPTWRASPSPYHAVANAAATLHEAGFDALDEQQAWDELARRATWPGAGRWWRGARPRGPRSARRIPHRGRPHRLAQPAAQAQRPDAGGRAGGSSPSRSTAARSSTPGSTAIWACRGAWRCAAVRPCSSSSTDRWRGCPQLAIHLDREVNERGLLLDKQLHLTPVWGLGPPVEGELVRFVAAQVPGARPRRHRRRGTSCSTTSRRRRSSASTRSSSPRPGSTTCARPGPPSTAAGRTRSDGRPSMTRGLPVRPRGGGFGEHDRRRRAARSRRCSTAWSLAARGVGRRTRHRALAASSCVSADMAHAVHPNYPERHEPGPPPAPQRRARCSRSTPTSATPPTPPRAALFTPGLRGGGRAVAGVRVPQLHALRIHHRPAHRRPGSASPPSTSGCAQLSMHSARELCGADDPGLPGRRPGGLLRRSLSVRGVPRAGPALAV